MEYDTADKLDIMVPLADRAPGSLADHRKGFGQQIVERGAFAEPSPETVGFRAEFVE